LSLRAIEGEIVKVYSQKAMAIVDEIRMTALLPELVPDLASFDLMGLYDASDDNLRAKALDAMTKCDDLINDAGQMIRPEPNEVLAPLIRLYAVMDQRGIYGPSKKTKTPLAMQAKVDPATKTTLESDMSSGQSQREVRKCYECGTSRATVPSSRSSPAGRATRFQASRPKRTTRLINSSRTRLPP
jgi:hypothetical protein